MAYKGAILVVSFGSSVDTARNHGIQPIEDLIKKSHPDYYVTRAFTSRRIIEKLKKTEGLKVDSPEEGLQHLIDQGFKQIIIQPLHIIAGYEFDKIKKTIKALKTADVEIKLGKPLLYYDIDYLKVIEGLKTQLPMMNEKQIVVLIGHGTDHPANAYYDELQIYIKGQELPILVGTIEEGVEPVIPKIEDGGYNEVLLMPFLLVAGDHVQNDLLGEEKHSWKSKLEEKGYLVKAHSKGLGENPVFQNLYLDRVKALIKA